MSLDKWFHKILVFFMNWSFHSKYSFKEEVPEAEMYYHTCTWQENNEYRAVVVKTLILINYLRLLKLILTHNLYLDIRSYILTWLTQWRSKRNTKVIKQNHLYNAEKRRRAQVAQELGRRLPESHKTPCLSPKWKETIKLRRK